MQIVFVKFFDIFPCVSSEFALPVGRRDAVAFSLAEDEEILVVRVSIHRFSEPFVAGRHVVEHHVEHQPDVPLPGLCDKFLHILHGAVAGIDVVVVLHIVPVVVLRGYEERSEPDVICAELFDIVQFFNNAAEVAEPILVGVAE